jgi:hypothetical protein
MKDQEILDNAPESAIHVDGGLLYTDKNGICVSQSGYSSNIPSIRSLADIKELVELRKANAELEKDIKKTNEDYALLAIATSESKILREMRSLEQQAKGIQDATEISKNPYGRNGLGFQMYMCSRNSLLECRDKLLIQAKALKSEPKVSSEGEFWVELEESLNQDQALKEQPKNKL